MIHLDTSFLVDLRRETRRGREGPARGRLEGLAEIELRVSIHALCELFAGVALSDRAEEERAAIEALTAGFEMVLPGAGFAPVYGRLLAQLQNEGRLISTLDLLIATAAVLDAAPIATRNPQHFDRIPGLEVIGY